MVKRILDANQHFVGTEPKFTGEVDKMQLIKFLNWYAQNKNKSDADRYGHAYLKKVYKLDASEELKEYTTTFGFLCRLITNGVKLPESNRKWFDDTIATLKKKVAFRKKQESKEPIKKIKVSVRDHLNEKVSEIIGDLEGSIDDYILSKYKETPSPISIMQDRAKGMHANLIIAHFRKRRQEFDNVINTKDAQIVEGYSNFKKLHLKKLIAYCDLIITDAMLIVGNSKKTRKPRKRKQKEPDQLVSKVNVCAEDKDLGLKSIDAKHIIGASQIWVYNVTKRKLGCYHAGDAGGLSIKGNTIQNFDSVKSVQKTVRKPNLVVPEIVSEGKVFLRSVLDAINSVPQVMSGRLSKDIILLRAIK